MHYDVIIIGQGICGTLLSWFLHKEGKSFIVIDKGEASTSSKVAAGIINPVTGRRYVYSWMIDEVTSFAKDVYHQLGTYFNTKFIHQKSIIDFFPSAQMRDAFTTRLTEDDTYLHTYPDQNSFNLFFNYNYGCGEIKPSYIVHVNVLLQLWKQQLQEWNVLLQEEFDVTQLEVQKEGIQYKNIKANKIIFCDGIAAAQNPWFQLLPFSANKGEALIIESAELPLDHIFKKGLMLAPLAEENLFWVGSNYQWEFEDENPSPTFYQKTKEHLEHWLKVPFKIVDHKAAVRPATLERRPFVGFHPINSNIGILNGMGTKGTSLAPFFAHQLVQHIVHNLPIMDEANVHRFSRILSK